MRRRRLIGLLGATALAGCSSDESAVRVTPARVPADDPSSDGGANPGSGTDDRTNQSRRPEYFSIVDLQTGPRTVSLFPTRLHGPDGARIEGQFLGTATSDRPARVRATLTNGNDWRNTFRLTDLPLFRDVPTGELPAEHCSGCMPSLSLAPTSNHDLSDADLEYDRGLDGYWHPASRQRLPRIERRTVALDPGERVTGEYVLLNGRDHEGFPPGRYEFERYRSASVALGVWDTAEPGPTTTSQFADASMPELSSPWSDDSSQTYLLFHDATPESEVFLKPEKEHDRLPAAFSFALVNHSRRALDGNPRAWGLWKLVADEWFHVAPSMLVMPAASLQPGDTYRYTLFAFSDDAVDADDRESDLDVSVGFLGGGRYAFRAGFPREDGALPAAVVDLAGPQLSLRPTDEATATERSNDTVRVRAMSQSDRVATLVVERVETGGSTVRDRFIPEQVMRRPYLWLRDTLSFFEPGVQQVELTTDRSRIGYPHFRDADRHTFRFGDDVYTARLRESAPQE